MLKTRKKKVIELCLNCFVERGLFETTTRDLSKAINLQSGGIYQYFNTKDEMVITCAEATALKLEERLILHSINDIEDPDLLMQHLHERADEMSATMKFFHRFVHRQSITERCGPFSGSWVKDIISMPKNCVSDRVRYR